MSTASEELLVGLDERAIVHHPVAESVSSRAGGAGILVACVAAQLAWLGGFVYAAYWFLSQ